MHHRCWCKRSERSVQKVYMLACELIKAHFSGLSWNIILISTAEELLPMAAGATFLSSSISCTFPPSKSNFCVKQTHVTSSVNNLRNGQLLKLRAYPRGHWGFREGLRLDAKMSLEHIVGVPNWSECNGAKRRAMKSKASRSSITMNIRSQWYRPDTLERFWNKRVIPKLTQLTPLEVSKWATMAAIAIWAAKLTLSILLNPYVWMYGSWFLIVWPWPTAVLLGLAALFAAFRKSKGKAGEREQMFILAASLLWLIIVPPAHLNGYLEGWPLMLFIVYFGFFMINSHIRYTLYGDLSPRPDDKQWKTSPSRIVQIAFVASVVGAHLLAAYESPPLSMAPGGWNNVIPSLVLFLAMALHYNATHFLGKYSDRFEVPTTVVMFGPYRWIRHPIYTSYMLLFAGYCIALRAYVSLFLLILVCFLYYEHRAKLEEDMLVKDFGDLYTSYREKVSGKYIPFVY